MRTIEEILDELENHLFDKYCVQGDDEKLKSIFDDIKEIQKQEKEQIVKCLEKELTILYSGYPNCSEYDYGYEHGQIDIRNRAIEIVKAGGKE